MIDSSVRAKIVTQRSYTRTKQNGSLESWPEVVDRCIEHQRWLWERQLGRALNDTEQGELEKLRIIMLTRKGELAGRTLWLGGTETSRANECSQFNCSFTVVRTVHDVVDVFWLLLNGCGVGFEVEPGNLFGYASNIPELRTIPSTRKMHEKGNPKNHEHYENGVWTIQVGDSAVAWAKAVGKLIAGKHRGCERVVLDFSQIRGEGGRLKGYGWICHGYKPLMEAMVKIHEILDNASGRMLGAQETHEILNLLGTVLSTRRSAQIALCDSESPWSHEFATFKNDREKWWRGQSNNTISFKKSPGIGEIGLFVDTMVANGNGEPGIRNAESSRMRCPWARGTNPCAEILLPDKGFCNLVEVNLAHPDHADHEDLLDTICLLARANYRQTCVRLDNDPILQRVWHENNQNIRLCGVGLTGIMQREDLHEEWLLKDMREWAKVGAKSMADELGTPVSQAVTTIKPSGTMSKIMDCTEGVHMPLGKYIFNRVAFKGTDPLVDMLRRANYTVEPHPFDEKSVLVVLPVAYEGLNWREETALEQLDRYLMFQQDWADHNVSCTVYYNEDEADEIVGWLDLHWDDYVAVSFLPRNPNESYAYYPQIAVSKEEYYEYVGDLKPLPHEADQGFLGTVDYMGYEPDKANTDCATGACPIN